MADKSNTRGAAPSRRLRISSWADPIVFMNGSTKEVTLPDGSTRNVFIPDSKNLFKTDALKTQVLSGQPNGFRVLDDISLLQTILDDNTSSLGIGWDKRALQSATDQVRKKFFNDAISHCHDVLGVQCLIGFERARLDKQKGKEPKLATWLKMPTPSPSIDDVTNRIVAFCEDNLPDYDGISFDLEGLGGSASDLVAAKANIANFYKHIADKIRSPTIRPNPRGVDKGFDRLVAFAAGNLIGRVDGSAMKSSRLLKHNKDGSLERDSSGNFVSASPPLVAAFFEQAQDYSLGTADRNLIIRPMAYDNFKRDHGPQVLDDWHADIVRFMLEFPTATFQLGVKTIDGPGQKDRKAAPKETVEIPPDKVKGMDGVMGGVGAGPTARIDHVRRRCRDLLHPKRIGLCFFPTSASFWKDANEELNPTVPEAGRHLGHPVQCPLSREALAILNKTAKPSP